MSEQNVKSKIAKIKVFGVGGGGCNAVNRMLEVGVKNVEFYLVNTDSAVLNDSAAENRIYLGDLGAGGNPEKGLAAAKAKEDEIKSAMEGADMVFVTAGMGGGTGTGAAPFIAKLSKDMGILTVGVVTKPFNFEGRKRMLQALDGLDKLRQNVDSLIIISNNKLLEVIGGIPFDDAFKEADNVLRQAVQTITDLITVPIVVNVDFADVRAVMENQGNALIGIGMADGDNKAVEAATRAIQSPLLEAKIQGAKHAIINITGGSNLNLLEIQSAVETVSEFAQNDLDIIWGQAINPQLGDAMIVTVIATGFEDTSVEEKPVVKTAAPSAATELFYTENSQEKEAAKDNDFPMFFKDRN